MSSHKNTYKTLMQKSCERHCRHFSRQVLYKFLLIWLFKNSLMILFVLGRWVNFGGLKSRINKGIFCRYITSKTRNLRWNVAEYTFLINRLAWIIVIRCSVSRSFRSCLICKFIFESTNSFSAWSYLFLEKKSKQIKVKHIMALP